MDPGSAKDYSCKKSIFFKIFNFFVTFRPVSEFIINIVYKLQPCITFNRENPIHRIKIYLGSGSIITDADLRIRIRIQIKMIWIRNTAWLLQSVNKGTVDVFIVNLHLKSFTSDSQWFPLNHFKQKLLIELLLKFCNFIIFNCFIFINFEPRDLLML